MDIHVLLVEPDKSFVDFICGALQSFGRTYFHVESIPDVETAKQIAVKEAIDVALVHMVDGSVETLTDFKRLCPTLPIVALTVSPDPGLAFRTAISGAANMVVLTNGAKDILPRAVLFAAANRGRGAVQDARREELSSRRGLDDLSQTLSGLRSRGGGQ